MKTIQHFAKAGVAALGLLAASCGSLELTPFNEQTSATVYNDPASYRQVLAKVYAGLAVTGQQGPAGRPDISGGDEGFSSYLRQYWQLQELTTDEAMIRWQDVGLPDLHNLTWTSGNQFVQALYYRLYYQIALSNEYIRETTDAKLGERGVSGQLAGDVKRYRAEARFMRALSYWHALDLFGNVPFVTEADAPGAFFPKQTTRAELFNYIESELKAIDADLADPRTNEYGRADKAAAWTLLAKLYLNAQVYTGTARWNDAVAYCNRVISSNAYTLEPNYTKLFRTDNNTSREIIFAIAFDGTRTLTWGGMTYLIHAPIGGSMNPGEFGVAGGWAGLRTTKGLVNLFADNTGRTDRRAQFWTTGQNLEINDPAEFTDGFGITKWRNVSSTGAAGTDPGKTFPDTDFPMFRLADVYLMYAEAVLRGGTGGDVATALNYVNQLRQRAYGNATGNVSSLNLNQILDERGRELYWEGHRRTDLIRYDRFTTNAYLWPWKGGVKEGRAVEAYRNLFPIPAAEIIANPGLKQNEGYK